MIKAVFLDVDGTLVSFRTHEVPRSAVGALRAAHARGVRLFIATGRTAGVWSRSPGFPTTVWRRSTAPVVWLPTAVW